MKKNKFLFVLTLLVIAAVIPGKTALAAKDNVKIGVVDIQSVIENTKEGKRAREALNKEVTERKNLFEEKKKELTKKQGEFNDKKLVANNEVLEKMRKDLEGLTIEIQKLAFESQNEMKKRESDLLGDILKKIQSVVVKVSTDKGLDVTVEKTAAPFFKKDFDITDDVVKTYDKTYK